MATIVHFDIGADDPGRAKKFYEALFGWKIAPMQGFPDYYEIETEGLDGRQSVGGGLTKRFAPQQTGITNFIGITSIDATLEKLVILGGKIIQPKQAIRGYGYMAVCADTENNLIGIFQDDKNAQ